jgi:hypothetical protein
MLRERERELNDCKMIALTLNVREERKKEREREECL